MTSLTSPRRRQKMHARGARTAFATHLCAAIVLCAIQLLIQAPRQAQASDYSYDPEQQDGIPIFSARSIAKHTNDADWNAGEQVTAPNTQQQQRRLAAQRRQADADLDDGLEDEDEDEYKSGSSPQESIENPSYGESVRAARDGDEIEDFFDKHLGPPQEATTADESATSVTRQEVPALDPDTDDPYEAAASSPLSNIFHSLLASHSSAGEHKHKHRPAFLHIATSSAASEQDSGKAEAAPSAASSSSSPPSSSSSPSGSLKASQSAQSFVEAAPIALTFAPIAASSQLVALDPSGQEAAAQEPSEPSGGPSGGVREIYIGRRPTVMSYLQQTYAQQQQQQQQHALPGYSTAGSSTVWRGAPSRQPAAELDGQPGDYARYPIAASYAYQREQPNVAASAAAPSGGGGGGDDEQTVTYGLSFGGAPAADEGAAGGGGGGAAEGGQEEQASGAEANEQQEQQPYQQGYVPYSARYSASSTRAHNNYHNQAGPYYRQAYWRPMSAQQQQIMMQQQQQPAYHHQYYSRSGSTRYHRDPSESMSAAAMAVRMPQQQQQQQQYYAGYQQLGAAQYRNANGGGGGDSEENHPQPQQAGDDEAHESSNGLGAQQLAERQRLLATLDREIKASPHYRSNNAAAAAAASSTAQTRLHGNQARGRPGDNRQHLLAIKTIRKSYKGDDLDSFNSYHSEVDPYRTFTSTSRMINDPTALANNRQQMPMHSGSDRVPATDSNYVAGVNSVTAHAANLSGQNQVVNNNFLTGPLTLPGELQVQTSQRGDLLRNTDANSANNEATPTGQEQSAQRQSDVPNSRVRREDADEREIDNDVDDDGVWVDDDEDDDNRQQSSDVNETAQDPESDEETDDGGQQDAEANHVPVTQHQMNPPGVIGGPHGYELSPNDLMIYHG